MSARVLSINLFCLALLIGLATNRLSWVTWLLVLCVFVTLIVAIKFRKPTLLILSLVGLTLGIIRSNSVWAELAKYDDYYGRDIALVAKVIDDAVYGFRRQAEYFVDNIMIHDGTRLPGKIRISGYGTISVKRGDTVLIQGELRRGYGSYQGTIGFSEYEVLGRGDSIVEKFRHKFIASTYSVLPEPESSLGLGFLAGFRSLLPEQLEEDLSITGLTHIVAVSGYNTTILASAVQASVARIGSRRQVVAATLALLLLFMSITGAAPSIIRASVVSGLSLFAWYFGRCFKASVLLLVSAAVTAYMSPLYLWYGLGWWLSFLAFFGVLIIAPLVSKRYFKKKPNILAKTALETTSAQLMTLPLIIWVFGRVSAIALLANILVLPAIPFAMLTTFVAGIASMSGLAAAGLLAWPARFVLGYITDIITVLARIPWALSELEATKLQMLMIYGVIGLITLGIHKKLQLSSNRVDKLY